MKITLLYLRVLGKSDSSAPDPSYYKPFHDRFRRTYAQFKPAIPHELVVCNCGVAGGADSDFDEIATGQVYYNGPAWDIGTYQAVAPKIESDVVYCMASPVYFWRSGWLEPIANAAKVLGPGAYAPMASYENSPHLRTGAFAFHPKLMRDYPSLIDTRPKCIFFESCRGGFTWWSIGQGYPTVMVTERACYEQKDWRTPQNIYRRGDQTNCLVWDRHTDIYNAANPTEKAKLERAADRGRA